ncbi:MAG TPA: hypothetical protein VMD09_00040, partial [Solirubrobacteraceae bacterium]|nr:hypothetical protein [Solirubrobacteraceae bacterium]
MPLRRSLPALLGAAMLVTLLLLVATPRAGAATASSIPASPKDYAKIALDIIPAGEYQSIPAPTAAYTQAKMYDALT